jgi:RNA polymerase sigma-70 factor (ECF subfamily)
MANSEKEWIESLVRNDRKAQKLLYEQHFGRLMGVCMRYAGSKEEAMDLLHEGFIKIFFNISTFKPGTSLEAWTRTIIMNTCIDHHRKSIRRRTSDIDDAVGLASDEPDVFSQLSEKEIVEAIQNLTPAYRAVFNLFVVEGCSHKEIAEALQITEGTSRSNLVKARLRLQEYFSAKRMDLT